MKDDDTGAPASGDAMAKVTNFSFNQTNAVIETTALGDTDRTVIPGVRSLSGSCKLFYYGYTEGGNDKNDCARLQVVFSRTPNTTRSPITLIWGAAIRASLLCSACSHSRWQYPEIFGHPCCYHWRHHDRLNG